MKNDPHDVSNLSRDIAQSIFDELAIGQAVQAFVGSTTWEQAREVVQQYPELLTDQADGLLKYLAEQEENERGYKMMEEHRAVLRQCREIGIEEAFAEKMQDEYIVPEQFKKDVAQAQEAKDRFERTGDPTALDAESDAWQRIVNHADFGDSDRSFLFVARFQAGISYFYRFERNRRLADLDQAINLWREALELASPESTEIAPCLSNLIAALIARHEITQDAANFDALIDLYEEWGDVPDVPQSLVDQLLYFYAARFGRTRSLDHLAAAISAYEKVVTAVVHESPMLGFHLYMLGQLLKDRCKQSKDLNDLRLSIERFEQALAHGPTQLPPHVIAQAIKDNRHILSRCDAIGVGPAFSEYDATHSSRARPLRAEFRRGYMAHEQFQQTGRLDTLDEAIIVLERIVAAEEFETEEPDFRLVTRQLLGLASLDRFRLTRNSDDLSRSIRCAEEALECVPVVSPERALNLSNLGTALRERYLSKRNEKDLYRATQVCREAVDQIDPHSQDLPLCLYNLAGCLKERYTQSADLSDLTQAVELFERSVAQTPLDDPKWPRRTYNLAVALREQYRATHVLTDIERAIKLLDDAIPRTGAVASNVTRGMLESERDACRSVLELSATESTEDAFRVVFGVREAFEVPFAFSDDVNRAREAHLRFIQTGDPRDLSTEAEIWEHIVSRFESTAWDGDFLVGSLMAAGSSRLGHFHACGDPRSLERARHHLEAGLRQASQDCFQLPRLLALLGAVRHAEYERAGNLEDLNHSIELLEQAVRLVKPGSSELPFYLATLSGLLSVPYVHHGDTTNLDRRIELLEQSTRLLPRSTQRAMILSSLGIALHHRYKEGRDRLHQQRAIDILDEAFGQVQFDSPEQQSVAANFATVLMGRYEENHSVTDLEKALRLIRTVVAVTTAGDSHFSSRMFRLGEVLQAIYQQTDDPKDLQQAVEAFDVSAKVGLERDIASCIYSSSHWAHWAFQRQAWDEVVRASDYLERTMDRLMLTQGSRDNKETWLRRVQGSAARKAYALARSGDVEAAAVTLERGAARLLSETLQRTADLKKLASQLPALSERYCRAASRVAELERRTTDTVANHPAFLIGRNPPTHEYEKMRTARSELDAVLYEIRNDHGWQDFLLPQSATLDEVRQAMRTAPKKTALVYFATTAAGSLALVVGSDGVLPVWLNNFTGDELSQYVPRPAIDGSRTVDGFSFGLGQLGDRIMRQVAAELRWDGVEHVVLVPTGPTALLPLHVAWYFFDGKPLYLLDEFTVSYAPNARAWLSAGKQLAVLQGEAFLVGVGNPLPNPKPLQAAEDELKQIAELFRPTARKTFLGPLATREAVLQAAPQATHLHFACHGVYDPATPSNNCLALAGEDRLIIGDFVDGHARLTRVRLAVLSACRSAMTEFRELPDEFLGLPAGLLHAGVPGIMGTLWAVDDVASALVVTRFYELQLERSTSNRMGLLPPAEALRQAQLWLRNVTREELDKYLEGHLPLKAARRQLGLPRDIEALPVEANESDAGDDSPIRPFGNDPYYWAPFVFVGV